MSEISEMISLREFARRDGCDDKWVRVAIKNGALPRIPGKVLPANLVGTGWRYRNRLGAETADCPSEVSAPEPTLAEAVRRREVALANRRRHEWMTRSAQWVARADAERLYTAMSGSVCLIFRKLPAKVAPLVAGSRDPRQIQTALRDSVYDALAEASGAKGPPPRPAPPGAGVAAGASKLEAETAKVEALGDLHRLDLDIAQGAVLNVAEVSAAIGQALSRVRQRLLALPAELPPRLVAKPSDAAEALIRAAVEEALDELPDALSSLVGGAQ
jgi:hypothetical protein